MEKRNIAIVAHVDHGKTTLVDSLLKQSNTVRANREIAERVMDSNTIEKERGITILAKCTSITWKNTRINIVDTPGHSDFGSEVERILRLVDCIIVVVDAAEGIMSQTKFVLSRAMEYKLKVIIFVNKVDRVIENSNQLLSLEEQNAITPAADDIRDFIFEYDTDLALECPVFYGSGRDGFASSNPEDVFKKQDLTEVLDSMVDNIPPVKKEDGDFRMLVSLIDHSEHLGKLLVGKITTGELTTKNTITAKNKEGIVEKFRVNKLMYYDGIDKKETEKAESGDIIIISGAKDATVNDTLAINPEADCIEAPKISPPTLSVLIYANNSPIGGKEGKKLTTNQIKERLKKEAEVNVGLQLINHGEKFEILGKGELQLSVLIENMRREGFELTVSSPKVLFKQEGGKTLEPVELVHIQVDEEYSSVIYSKMSERGAENIDPDTYGIKTKSRKNVSDLYFKIPTRLMMGYSFEMMSDTKGTGVLNSSLLGYEPLSSKKISSPGLIIATNSGSVTAYSLDKKKDRGIFFVEPGQVVYAGMVIGEHNRESNLEINCTDSKKLTNMRASGKDDMIKLTPARIMSFERCLTYISNIHSDTLKVGIEVTPSRISMRKL